MNRPNFFGAAALFAVALLASPSIRANNMVSVTIAPGTGVVTLVPQWSMGGNIAGFHLMAQDLSLGGGPNQFYSIKGTTIPSAGDTAAFTVYLAASGVATDHTDIGSKLTPDSYSALTSADPDLGFGAVDLYFIHHRPTGDYLATIVPGSGSASAVTDRKPMSGPGDALTAGASGYVGLTFAAPDLGFGTNLLYYLRTDAVTGFSLFGTLDPALAGTSADKINFGVGGYDALAFTATDVGLGINRVYYLRRDPITAFTIFGALDLLSGRSADIANLGSVYPTLTFLAGDVGFGTNKFYATGSVNPTWQSVSFAAIADRAISLGSFTVTPTASSTLPIALTMVPGTTGAAAISGPVGGVFTVTPTAPGLIILQATQAGQTTPVPYEYNMLRQSFTATGLATLAIITQPVAQSTLTGSTASFSVIATGTSALTYQWRKDGTNIVGNASATTATLTLTNVQASDAASYDVIVSNSSGSIPSVAVLLTVTVPAPVITNSPLTAGGIAGTPFTFTITATQSPTSYSASPLPVGLAVNPATGVISGTPTVVGATAVLLGATNATGSGYAALTITVAASGAAPAITNNPLTAAGTVGTPFSFTITATNSPSSYDASPLPAGLTVNPATGAISGTPTFAGTTAVLLSATNGAGTGYAALTITVAPAGVAPIITNNPLTAGGTVGTPFVFTVTATGSPTNYGASPLPAGLSVNSATGAITGTPTAVGTTAVLLSATNAVGAGYAALTVTVAPAGVAPIITNNPLTAAGTVGTLFGFTLAATGSPTSYSASPLPAGLAVNVATGAISGTPTAAGTTNVLLGATNAVGTGYAALSITVAAAGSAPIITNNPLTAAGTVGTPFGFAITATGSPSSYSASPLPAGLAVNVATGNITGTPTVVGATAVLLSATNAVGTGYAALTITVAPAGIAPVITNRPLTAGGTMGTPFGFTITATGSPTSYTASPLPAGLALNPATGVIAGTPTVIGSTAVLLGGTNAAGTGYAALTITVAAAGAAPLITNNPLTAAGTVGTPFGFAITATGSPTTYGASPLPAGLSIVASTGALAGVPTATGTTAVLLSATNSAGTGYAALTITVAPAGVAPIVTNSPLTAGGTVGTPFGFTITATGSPTAYAAGPLPAGLSLDPVTGVIGGLPTAAGTTTVLLGATNATGTGNATLTLTVAAAGVPPLVTNSPLTAVGTIGAPFGFTITATSSPTSYAASPLPAGLSINSITGTITGSPTVAGTTAVLLAATNAAGTGHAALSIAVTPAGVTPVITNNPLTAAGTVGTPLGFTITATGLPTSYSASPLPVGLVLNAATGSITGTPTVAGTTAVLLGAANALGSGYAALSIAVGAAGVAPIVTNNPLTATGTVGTPFGFTITATGSPTSYAASPLPAGLGIVASTGVLAGIPSAAGTTVVLLGATNAAGTGQAALTITVLASGVASHITNSPLTATGTVGKPFSFTITASGAPFNFSATPLPAGLTLNAATGAVTGTPTTAGTTAVTLTATNATGTDQAVLTIVVSPAASSRIVNFSARALSGPGDQTLIVGFVVAGDGKNLLVRGVGPSLAPFGVTNVLVDPMLTLYDRTGALTTNDDWQVTRSGEANGALIAATAARVGAFALSTGSKDSALLFAVNHGAHTTSMVRPNSTTGVALTEIYDIDAGAGSRLINVSARMNVSVGEGTLIAGFVIAGNAPTTVLIRGVGPTLSGFAVGGALANPLITVYQGSTPVAGNDDWETDPRSAAQIRQAGAQVGAFPLLAGGKDAAVVVTLEPGSYTVQVTGVGNTTGVALVEVYELPPSP